MTTSSYAGTRFPRGGLLAFALAAAIAHAQPAAAAGLHVSGTRVLESNGNNLVLRGINHEHAWFLDRTSAIADIKSVGANVIRVVLSGGRWTTNTPADVANIVALCKANRVICILEDHDTTGYGEDGAAYTLDQAVTYFATLQGVLAGQEDYVIINPGNEPIGNNNPSQWISATTGAVTRLRALGFQHLIMIDAPNWGQDWQYVMRDNAQTIAASDPNRNLVFSIHMYGVFNTPAAITSYLDTFRTAGLPLVIGEFGYRNNNSANVDHDTVMAEAVARGLGYLGWSWMGNNDPYLDMTFAWDKNNLTPWGQRFLNGPNGLTANSQEATIFGISTTYGLTVAKAGTGSGTVTSSSGGINCGTTCSASYASGTSVTLTASAASGSTFGGWSGACVGSASTCIVSMTAARTVTATFNPVVTNVTLTVAKAGTGSGTVTSSTGGINCGTVCTASVPSGTTVTLTAAAASGSSFASWSGCTSSSGTTCTVSMTAARTVTATFNPISTGTTVSVNAGGAANGGFIADAYFSGGSTYSTTAAIDTSLVPGAVPPQAVFQTERYGQFTYTIPGFAAGSAQNVTLWFAETYWTAAGQRTFNVAINGATVLTAFDIFAAAGRAARAVSRSFDTTANASGQVVIAFTKGGGPDNPKISGITVAPVSIGTSFTLNVNKGGTGASAGTVTSTPAGINCGSSCAANYASGTAVTLAATAGAGGTFTGWSGACTGTGTCIVTMTAAQSVTATFTGGAATVPLGVTKAGTGAGTVSSSPAGIACGATCTASFPTGSLVTLSAAPTTPSTFGGWSGGGCSGTAATCVVTMSAAQSVTATFNPGTSSFPLTVTKGGTGTGTVTSAPAGISCGATCSASFAANSSITLTATPTSPSTFTSWTGCTTSTGATCVVSMTAARSVTATFTAGGGTTPCANPVDFTGNTGNFNSTGAACYRTTQTVNGWGCSNFTGRTVSVNGGTATSTCGAGPFPLAKVGGYTYFSATAGQYPWASIYVW